MIITYAQKIQAYRRRGVQRRGSGPVYPDVFEKYSLKISSPAEAGLRDPRLHGDSLARTDDCPLPALDSARLLARAAVDAALQLS
jgi:hypothetical protein